MFHVDDTVSPEDGSARLAALPTALLAGPLAGAMVPQGMQQFPATQLGMPRAETPAAKRPRRAGAESSPSDAEDVVAAPSRVQIKRVSDGICFNLGYGPGGVTAQVSWTEVDLFKSDREIMQKTVLRGKPVVKYSEICDLLRRDVPGVANPAKKTKQGFPKRVWEDVMHAGLALYPIGILKDAGSAKSRVEFYEPPTETSGEARLAIYHNMLVDLCRVGGRQFRQLLAIHAQERASALIVAPEGAKSTGSADKPPAPG